MAIDPSIALGVRGIELQNPLNALAQFSQIQGAQQANKLGQMQMSEYERARTEEEGLRNYLAGADLGAAETRNALMAKFGKTGREFAKGLTELDKAKTEEAARKAKLAIDKTAMYRDAVVNITNPADAIEFMKLQASDPDMAGTPITRMPLMKVLSTIPQDPVGFENWKKQTALGMSKFVELNKPSVQTINQGGQTQVLQTPGLGGTPVSAGTYADVALPKSVEDQKARIARAGASNITVSNEKTYGSKFAGLIADSDAAKLAAAENAPAAAETADRILNLLSTGNVITGTGANVRLQMAKALNLAGGNDSEKIANTEVLLSSLAETTMGAIKSSNLGAGQGFTNADRDFLEKAKAGQITYDAKSLARLADLSRKAAEKSADTWNKRVNQIPKSALEGPGVSLEPVVVPPRKTASVMKIPSDAISALKSGAGTPEQFDAIFGAGSADRVLGKGK